LAEMDHPEQGLAYVHVAGTNGKGSTSLMIAEILIAAGYQVGRYSSPHLHSYRERFTVNGEEIEDQELWSYLQVAKKHVEAMLKRGEEHPTEFEVLTALAFQYFAAHKVDVAVLEVGMGGTYDSTNVIKPLVSVITSIDFDHTSFLGSTLAEIASNKAGIIKPGVPVVTGTLEPEAREVISIRAANLGAAVHSSSDLHIMTSAASSPDVQVVDIDGAGWNLQGLSFSLLGDYQLKNMAVAIMTINILKEMGFNIEADDVRRALGRIRIPGRLEIVSRQPLVILDAAHNPHGARALADSLELLWPGRKRIVVMGVLDDKDRPGMVRPLMRNTRAVVVTRPIGPRSSCWQEVIVEWQKYLPSAAITERESIKDAVGAGLSLLEVAEYLLITGSFYVLDEARRLFVKN